MPSAPNNPYALTTWGAQGNLYTDFTVPSGQTCQLRTLDITDLITAGLLEQVDSLMGLFQENVVVPVKGKKPGDRAKKQPTKAEAKALAEQQEQEEFMKLLHSGKFEILLRMVDQIVAACVIQPAISDAWHDSGKLDKDGLPEFIKLLPDAREEGAIYADMLPVADRFAIFGWAMEGFDLSAVAAFRDQPTTAVDDVANVTDVPLPAK